MSSVIRLFTIFASVFLIAGYGSAQDLGSSNKLFGGSKKPVAAAKTAKPKPKSKPNTSAKAQPAAKPKATTKKPALKRKPTEKPVAEEPAAKKNVAKNSTAKKTPTSEKPADKRTPSNKTVDGRFRSFGATAKPLTESSKRLYEQLVDAGNRARSGRNYAEAETAYKKAAAISGEDPRAVYALGTVYSDQQRWEDAEAAYRAALKLDVDDVTTTIALSYVLTQPLGVDNLSERYAEAEALAHNAIKLAPGNPLAHDQLGVALELRGLTGSETEAAYRRAIRLNPYFAPAHAHLGRLLRRRGQTQASRDAYQAAIEKASDAGSLIVIAEVMHSEQRYADSEPLLRRALDNDPRNAAALLLLGRALTVTGDHADAEILLRRALEVSPNGYMPNVLLAALYIRDMKHGQAETALLQAARSAPEGERMQLARQFEELGDAYFRGGKLANAQRCYREALRLNDKNLALKDKLARANG